MPESHHRAGTGPNLELFGSGTEGTKHATARSGTRECARDWHLRRCNYVLMHPTDSQGVVRLPIPTGMARRTVSTPRGPSGGQPSGSSRPLTGGLTGWMTYNSLPLLMRTAPGEAAAETEQRRRSHGQRHDRAYLD